MIYLDHSAVLAGENLTKNYVSKKGCFYLSYSKFTVSKPHEGWIA